MTEIARTIDDKGVADIQYRRVIRTLAQQLIGKNEEEDCVLFLGAGACRDSSKPSLPDGPQLSRELAAECELDWHEHIPLSTIAYYYEFLNKRRALNDFLVERIDNHA